MNTSNIQKLNLTGPAKKRMSLDAIREGKLKEPWRLAIYGPEKIGKSTFASLAPSPIWIGADRGTGHLDIKRMAQPDTWGEVREGLADVRARGRSLGYQTLVVDPLGWFEALAIRSFAGDDPQVNLATWGGGHGAGYAALESAWRIFLKDVEGVWLTGMNVILIAHSAVKIFKDPMSEDYERYEMQLDKRTATSTKQWVDHILFTKREAYGQIQKNKNVKAKGSGAVMLYTNWTPQYDAGNRASLPPEMPLSWDVFYEALMAGAKRIDELKSQIEAALAELAEPETEAKVRAWMADRNANFMGIANAVMTRLEERRTAVDNETPAVEATEAIEAKEEEKS